MTLEVRKLEKRSRYPWAAMEVEDTFVIEADNLAGVNNARQLAYAATKASERKGEGRVFKSFKNEDGSVTMRRVA
jgi:hypothetical protein